MLRWMFCSSLLSLIWLHNGTEAKKYQSMADLDDFPVAEYTVRLDGQPDNGYQSVVEFYRHNRYGNVCVKVHTASHVEPWMEIEVLQYLNAREVEFVPRLFAVYKITNPTGTFAVMVMEYIGGQTLRQLIANSLADESDRRQEILTISDVNLTSFMEKLLTVIAQLHDYGIVHRDLSTSNVMIDASGDPHVIDFGLTVFLQPNEVVVEGHRNGRMRGNRLYFAPESIYKQFKPAADSALNEDLRGFQKNDSKRWQGRSGDLWAYGAILGGVHERLPDGCFAPTPAEVLAVQPSLAVEREDKFYDARDRLGLTNIACGFNNVKLTNTPADVVEFARKLLVHDSFKRPTAREALVLYRKLLVRKSLKQNRST